MHLWDLILLSFAAGIYGNAVDVKFCTGTSRMIDSRTSELNFYRHPDASNYTKAQCSCNVTSTDVMNSITVQPAVRKLTSCFDSVIVVHAKTKMKIGCQDAGVSILLEDKAGFQLVLDEDRTLLEGSKVASVLPLKVQLDPVQSSLKLTCGPVSDVTSGGVSVSSAVSTTSTTEAPVSSNTTAATPKSEANYTILVVGLVAVGVIAGTCVVCVVLCRLRRESEEGKERIHQTVYRKASTMYKNIMTRRPLPNIPQSLRRVRRNNVLEPKDSGLYDSIHSQRGRARDLKPDMTKTEVTPSPDHTQKPQMTMQLSNGSSNLYIHPVDVAKHNNETFGTVSPKEIETDTYLTKVVISDTTLQDKTCRCNTEALGPVDRVHKDALKESVSYVNIPGKSCYINMPVRDRLDVSDHAGSEDSKTKQDSTGSQENGRLKDTVYMSMKGYTPRQSGHVTIGDSGNSESSDCMSDNNRVNIVNESQAKSDEHVKGADEPLEREAESHPSTSDNTFPQLLKFEPFSKKDSDAEHQATDETKPKPKRYVRILDEQSNDDRTASA